MVNQILNDIRDTKNFRHTEELHLGKADLQDDDTEGFFEEIFESVSPEEIYQIISHLPVGYRMVFNLYAFEGYGHQEIAETLGISINTSKSQLMKARRSIISQIQKKIQSEHVIKIMRA